MKKILSRLIVCCFFILATFPLFSLTTEPHLSRVSSLAFYDNALFSAGFDGFVIKRTEQAAEPYQFTNLAIRFMAVNPSNGDLALYETDGFAVHRVSVWNWTSKTRKFVKILPGEIMSLSYTARGTYLILGSVTAQGAAFLNAQNGAQVSLLTGGTGIVSYAVSNAAETSLVMYTATGSLTYYDLRTKKVKATFQTETNLSGVVLYKNNLILAGIKENSLYKIDALSGRVLQKIPAREAVLTVNSEDDFLQYYAKNAAGSHVLYTETEGGFIDFTAEITGTLTAALKRPEGICAGTLEGDLFFTHLSGGEQPDRTVQLTEKKRKPVLDIEIQNGTAYFLTDDSYYQANLQTGTVQKLAAVSGFTNLVPYGNGAIFWSRGQKTPFTFIPDDNLFLREVIYSPLSAVQDIAVYGDNLVFVEGSGVAGLYNLQSRALIGKHTGTGFQSAALLNEAMYVAKSAATNPRTALISISLKTGETVAELKNSSGDAAYALTADKNILYGIMPRVAAADKKTDIFAYNTTTKVLRTVLTLSDEDLNADMSLFRGSLYTNLGKTQISVLDLARNTVQRLPRSSILPVKAVPSDTYILVLNTDGTVSVYNNKPYTLVANWTVSQNGDCLTF